MNVNYFVAQAIMDQAYSEKLQEAANERRWKRALRALRRDAPERVLGGSRSSTPVAA